MSSQRAIITLRGRERNRTFPNKATRSEVDESETTESVADLINNDPTLNITVEQRIADSVIVNVENNNTEGENDTFSELESRGYRVKVLPETNIIEVGNFRVDTENNSEEMEDGEFPFDLTIPADLANSWTHHLVQLVGPPTSEWIKRIEEQGVDVAEPLSRYALFVDASPEKVAGLTNLKMPDDPPEVGSFVSWTGKFQPAYRIAPELFEKEGTIQYINVCVFPETKTDIVAQAISEGGGKVIDQWEQDGQYRDKFGFLIAEIDAVQLNQIACLPDVRSIEYHAPKLSVEDERSAQIVAHQLDTVPPPNTGPILGYNNTLIQLGVDGSDVIVGICDTGVDTNDDLTMHNDLKGRMAFFVDLTNGTTKTDESGHGTHVAGIAVGNGNSTVVDNENWSIGQGIAPMARFGSINPVDTPGGPGTIPVGRFTKIMVENGAHIMNNSWKQSATNRYTANAALVDRLVRQPKISDNGEESYLVLVFSAGNSGPASGTITEPKGAKNPIIVGNSLNRRGNADIRGISQSSSRGPLADGRLCPTIVAPGTTIVSARPTGSMINNPPRDPFRDDGNTLHNNHCAKSGTSMAAPHVSGLCALLIQWWRTNNEGQFPSPALLKALLVNGAEDLAGGPDGNGGALRHIPNNDQGWGRVSLSNIITRQPKLIYDQVFSFNQSGEEDLFVVKPSDPNRPLRITLVWTDPPGATNASPALVNDLDLEVIETETNDVFKGNVFSNGFSKTGGNFDNLNNVECVYIEHPLINSTYEIRIIAQTLTGNALPPFTGGAFQDYALVIDNAEEVTDNP